MKLVIATHNPAKLNRYVTLLKDVPDLEIVSLTDLNITEKISEPHETAEQNAEHKVREYAKLTGLPTLSIDEAAVTNFLPENEEPGVYVRRVADHKTELTDVGLLDFWRETFIRIPEPNKQVIWDFRMAYLNPRDGTIHRSHVTMPCRVANEFSTTIIPGYPMSSFLILPGTDKPAADLTQEEKATAEKHIFASFVKDFTTWIR